MTSTSLSSIQSSVSPHSCPSSACASDPLTRSDHNYFSVIHQSNALSPPTRLTAGLCSTPNHSNALSLPLSLSRYQNGLF